MAKEYSRTLRVADQIQRELADLITREVNDSRLQAGTISGVDVSRDLSVATVYVTPQSNADVDDVLRAFDRASGFLRRGLAQRVRLRTTPRLKFVYDPTLDDANRIDALIETAMSKVATHSDADDDCEDR